MLWDGKPTTAKKLKTGLSKGVSWLFVNLFGLKYLTVVETKEVPSGVDMLFIILELQTVPAERAQYHSYRNNDDAYCGERPLKGLLRVGLLAMHVILWGGFQFTYLNRFTEIFLGKGGSRCHPRLRIVATKMYL